MNKKIRIGTRGSKLAVIQAEIVCNLLNEKINDIETEIITIKTKGDIVLDKTLDKIGGKGLFVKEIEYALLNNEIDIAVHSMKDMPVDTVDGLMISACTKREDPRDVLITKENLTFEELPYGATIGTSSLRRASQIKFLRDDIKIVPIRGNIISRIDKMHESLDGIVLAAAGLIRADMEDAISHYFDVSEIIPAVAQGILALETRQSDIEINGLCRLINDDNAYKCACAERAFLKRINGDCHSPIGCFAEIEAGIMNITGVFEKKEALYESFVSGNVDDYEKLGIELADKIIEM